MRERAGSVEEMGGAATAISEIMGGRAAIRYATENAKLIGEKMGGDSPETRHYGRMTSTRD